MRKSIKITQKKTRSIQKYNEPFQFQQTLLLVDRLHVGVQKLFQRLRETHASRSDKIALGLPQFLLPLSDLDQRAAVSGARPELRARLDHIQPQILQITEPCRLLLLDFLVDEVLDAIARIRYEYRLGVAGQFLRPVFCVLRALPQVLKVRVQFGFLRRAQLLLRELLY